MQTVSFEDKKAYFAKVRLTNYEASLKLEGILPANQAAAQSKASAGTDQKKVTTDSR
ncbi:MAG: DUF2559 family protein [Pseudohongiella sp.]|mgnify:CR=1 FL=1|nr:DUF2559 family protein [Pseudohongiella sp.]MDP3517075.1 DUF2559 family protein [Pseudohongiella sp.]